MNFCRRLGAHTVIYYVRKGLVELLQRNGEVVGHVVDNVGDLSMSYKQAHLFTTPQPKIAHVEALSATGAMRTIDNEFFLERGRIQGHVFVVGWPNMEGLALLAGWVVEGRGAIGWIENGLKSSRKGSIRLTAR
ncbi:hypothetical protein BO71DRAFT_84309 [Aspergillus ellipticus CBS 707.79]|uniref:Uncharacterized protein n=1 Tax=Aspergillus ellipticus CBS 707.79 TaxID=1448320 RepID=A0A319E897_9EURO|nr:hypothetical protein BO71DRAFT_84309 [Aspergillus ellipticus CBS 707.79]